MINLKKFAPKIYIDSNGQELHIASLKTPHLRNIVNKINRECSEAELPESYNDLVKELTLRTLRSDSSDVWVTKTGDAMKISTMETSHIENILSKWKIWNYDETEKITALKIELLKRQMLEERHDNKTQ
jgi:hypothetical protein